ncbi:zinc finger protein 3-like [Danaus plexippus]|uniref:zinc finger protein 3-like n=1 Tax=Danaus plexippus TaxID=13037 RepID=UPI002AB13C06|nr:zinc finger protein 3-like [Danaus plexippus]
MCEWLSCEEWCDVFLMCGGRVFSAHRAVLASVSKFLRKILLSCSVEDSPTFIVMPEFDFDTMSSVLHYIYNGEVAISRHQLHTFLDIMNALQVFVDTRDLMKHLKNNNYVFVEDDYTFKKENITSKDDVTLRKEIQKKSNVRRRFDKVNLDRSNIDSNFYKTKEIRLGYLKSLEDRQSQPFSRDLFIETYSLNRNGNGVTEGVLAISSERYREKGSLLEKNSNTEHHKEVATETTFDIGSRDNFNFLCNTKRFEITSKENIESFVGMYLGHKTNVEVEKIPENNYLSDIQGEEIPRKTVDQEHTSINCNIISRHSLNLDTKNIQNAVSRESEVNSEFNKSKEAVSKVTILNEVLQSPWRPRLSLTFTPYAKKCLDWKLDKDKTIQSKQNGVSINDKNNNNNESTKIENNNNEATSNIKEMKPSVSKDVTADNKDEHLTGSKSTRYTCTECHKTFSQLRNYKYHMSVHRGTKEFATTCPVCGKFFNDKGYLSSHMKIHKNRKEYKCNMCPKSFNQRVAYNMHVRIHTGVKPHVCDECGKAFSRKMLLKQHQRTHSGERPYACQHCNKRFADRSNMTLHLRLHTGVKPFACTLCPKSFTKKHHLKSHLNFHTGDKPYTCPRCKLAFTQSSNMRTHMKKCDVHKD